MSTPVLLNRDLLKRAALHAFWVFLALYIGSMLWMAVLSVLLRQFIHEPAVLCATDSLLQSSRHPGALLEPWLRWDTICYLNVAESGYRSNLALTVWPPLYPLLIRLLMFVTPSSVFSALVVSSISTWAAFLLLYMLVSLDYGEKTARGSLFLLAIYPLAFFLVAAYSESLFLALVLGSLLCMRTQRWGWAGLLAACAALTRNQGIVLALVLICEGLVQYGTQPEKRVVNLLKVCLTACLPVLAFGAYAGYVHFWIGADWPWQTLAKYWAQYSGFPWQGLLGDLRGLASERDALWYFWAPSRVLDCFFAISIPVFLIVKRGVLRPSYLVFAWVLVLISLMKLGPGDVLLSFSRYMLPVFPFFIAAAPLLEKRAGRLGLFSLGFMLQCLFLGMFYIWSWAG